VTMTSTEAADNLYRAVGRAVPKRRERTCHVDFKDLFEAT